ncbi:MAG: 3'(2'),5'-bisphosphate nucleotidase CysQ [Pseudomonadota bacterium]
MLSDTEIARLSRALLPATLKAGAAIMAHFRSGVRVRHKPDNSPVTLADQQAEDVILEALADVAPGVPVVAEEAASRGEAPKDCADLTGDFVLVDPLDGTRGFIKGRDEFTVNIGFVSDGLPVLGLVYAPAFGLLFASRSRRAAVKFSVTDPTTATTVEGFDTAEPLRLRAFDGQSLIAVSSRYQSKKLDAALAKIDASQINANSSFKFCMVAQGDAHFYPRLGEISEWDTGAGAGLLRSAGGSITGLDGEQLTYGKVAAGYRNAPFIAWGCPEPVPRILDVMRSAGRDG